jgi:hypothetical protein
MISNNFLVDRHQKSFLLTLLLVWNDQWNHRTHYTDSRPSVDIVVYDTRDIIMNHSTTTTTRLSWYVTMISLSIKYSNDKRLHIVVLFLVLLFLFFIFIDVLVYTYVRHVRLRIARVITKRKDNEQHRTAIS